MVIDYTSEDLVAAIQSRHPEGVDKALNGVEGETANQVVRAMRDGGRVVDLTGSASVVRPGVQVDIEYLVRADADRLARLARMIDDRHLTVEIQEDFPFERAQERSRWSKPSTCAGSSYSRSRSDAPLDARGLAQNKTPPSRSWSGSDRRNNNSSSIRPRTRGRQSRTTGRSRERWDRRDDITSLQPKPGDSLSRSSRFPAYQAKPQAFSPCADKSCEIEISPFRKGPTHDLPGGERIWHRCCKEA